MMAGLNSCEEDDEPVLLLNPSLEDRVPDITDEESAYTAIPERAVTEKRDRSPPSSFAEPNLDRSPPSSCDEDVGQCPPSSCDEDVGQCPPSSCDEDVGQCLPLSCDEDVGQCLSLRSDEDVGQCLPLGCDEDVGQCLPLGCDEDVGQCLSLSSDEDVGQCLSLSCDEDVGQCLPLGCDEDVGQCLPLSSDEDVGQCLPLSSDEDVGQCLPLSSDEDVGQCLSLSSDEDVGQCLPLSSDEDVGQCLPLSTGQFPPLGYGRPNLDWSPPSSPARYKMGQCPPSGCAPPKLDRSPSLTFDQTNLEWQYFNGSLPNGAVSIYNRSAQRTEYVSRYRCEAGFYNPDMGPYCHYPYDEKEHLGFSFEILVNKDDFEFLEWKKGSKGSVPQNSVKTASNKEIYVGKNKYGLGKVDGGIRNKAFFLPWKGKQIPYKDYEVLTFNSDISSEHISDVKYKTDAVEIVKRPPETMTKATLENKDCQTVTQTATLSKTIQVEERWDTNSSFTLGVTAKITAGIPLIGSADIEFSASTTFQFTKGTTHTESKEHNVAVECKVPPNHSCTVSMVGYKYEADIPYTARLTRTYSNGETRETSISGTYKRVQVMEVRSVVDRCEPLPDAKPCA
ncbi:hypothetical protein VZT92_018533 [Zoarces viviparus]|uniref:Uncharacterized protein n=1 Tax=Zoarces viviparus TaxID=48416 RepID=A0AAW1EIQ4_ZOAVI